MQKTKHRNLLLTPIRPSTCSGALSPLKYTSVELYCFVLFYIRLVVLHDESVLCNCIGILCSASERPLEAGEGKHLKLGKFNLSLLLTAPCGGKGGGSLCAKDGQSVRGTLLKEKQASPHFSPFSTSHGTWLLKTRDCKSLAIEYSFRGVGRSKIPAWVCDEVPGSLFII